MELLDEIVSFLVDYALTEDIGPGDVTTLACIEKGPIEAVLLAKGNGVLAGIPILETVFTKLDKNIAIEIIKDDGDPFSAGDKIVRISGQRRAILTGERTALNFLGHLSGIATLTARFVEKVQGTGAVILDTRKTTPGLRLLEKYAVTCGGGQNHRFGLYDMVLIKDNHIAACGSINMAVDKVKKYLVDPRAEKKFGVDMSATEIEVEIETEAQLREAIGAGVKRLLLDNQSPPSLASLVKIARHLASDLKLEASGNVNLDNVRAVAETGVDFISIGALTHSAPSSDFSLEILPPS